MDGDQFESETLTFNTVNDTRLQMDNHIMLSGDSEARSIELVSTADIEDLDNATLHVDVLARLIGQTIKLGDTENDCFSVDSNTVVIEAAVSDQVTLDDCAAGTG